jgi:hypothetical protein
MNRGAAAAVAAAALLASACVTGSYDHLSINEPLPAGQLAVLRPGEHALTDCLTALGAPNRVFEYRVEPDLTSGMALLWIWRETRGFGVQVSGAYKEVSGSFEYDDSATDLEGCMLWFDRDLVLERWRRGLVGDLVPGQKRPSAVP